MKPAVLDNLIKSSLLVVMALFVSVGCAKKETRSNNQIPPDTKPVAPGQVVYSGGTAPVDSFSPSVLEAYAGRSINNPRNLRVTLDVYNVANEGQPKQYGGTFKITYEEDYNGGVRTVTGTFNSGTSIYDTTYNKYYNTGGTQKLKLFFQDSLGGLVVSIEAMNVNDLETKYKGRVYFRNFDFGVCANPVPGLPPVCNPTQPKKCWHISEGPYSCRAYLNGGQVRPDIVDLPGFGDRQYGYSGPGYQQLFTFTDMDLNAALNADLD